MDFDKIFLRFKKYNYTKICKICDGECLRIFAHTAKCQDCGVSVCKDCVKGSKELDEYFCTKCE